MDSDDECTGPELDPGRPRRTGPSYNIFLESGRTSDTADETPARPRAPRRGRADVDHMLRDAVRIGRNIAILTMFYSAGALVVGFAGLRMGAPPWLCLMVAACGGPSMVLVSVKAFETVRPSLPLDGSGDQPSSGEP
ncbi:hypothetical protein [Streptomyces sp. NBC_01538]|uniref:hypothetical protein n=1 Tax=Streptomyces sp. NBC_01538 TaxID=2903897 RepID=UPI003868723B